MPGLFGDDVTRLLGTDGKLLGSEEGTTARPLIVRPPAGMMGLFGEHITGENYTLLDLINQYELDPDELETEVATGGTVTFTAAIAANRLSVTSSNGSSAKLQTTTYFRYQAGKTFSCFWSLAQDALVANQERRWGLYNSSHGLRFRTVGTVVSIQCVSNVTGVSDQSVDQADWNRDNLDGDADAANPSGHTLDVTKANLYEIRFQWLGVGTVQWYINGHLVHEMLNAGSWAGAYMRNANLPLTWEIINTGASTASNLDQICASVRVLGGSEPPGRVFSVGNSADYVVNTTELPVLIIRPKTTFNSITYRGIVMPKRCTIRTEGARLGYRLVLNPATITGGAWADVNTASSAVERNVTATAFTGGTELYKGFLGNSNDAADFDISHIFSQLSRKLRQKALTSTVDTLAVVAVNEAAGNTNVRAALEWKEVR